MNEIRNWLFNQGHSWLLFIGVFFGLVFLFGLVRRVFLVRFRSRLTRSEFAGSALSGIFLSSFEQPLRWATKVVAFKLALEFAPDQARQHVVSTYGIKVAFIVLGIWSFDRLITAIFKSRLVPDSLGKNSRYLLTAISHGLVYSLGGLVVLDSLHISITPILASLGVGSIAVALALQDTLANVFSGLYLLVDRPIELGDSIRLDNGLDAKVVKIGWRSTQVLLPNETMLILPNLKLSNSQIINFDLPSKEMLVTLEVGVGYGSDLEKVEALAQRLAKEVVLDFWPKGAFAPDPTARFTGFADSSIQLSLGVRIPHHSQMPLLKHALVKALHAGFEKHGIEIPFPQRVVRQISGDFAKNL